MTFGRRQQKVTAGKKDDANILYTQNDRHASYSIVTEELGTPPSDFPDHAPWDMALYLLPKPFCLSGCQLHSSSNMLLLIYYDSEIRKLLKKKGTL